MTRLLHCSGGDVVLPDPKLVFVDRNDGGCLIVLPPREVWDRSELTPRELTEWGFLVAAAAEAMLHVLPQLEGGCVNHWEAGNWALNEDAEPRGVRKTAREFRRVHHWILGRSPHAKSEAWRWGEGPSWPKFADRFAWTAGNAPLNADECAAIVARMRDVLPRVYGMSVPE